MALNPESSRQAQLMDSAPIHEQADLALTTALEDLNRVINALEQELDQHDDLVNKLAQQKSTSTAKLSPNQEERFEKLQQGLNQAISTVENLIEQDKPHKQETV